MDSIVNIFKLFGPRLVAAAAAAAATKLSEYHITVDPGTLVGIALATYAAVHKAISSKVNPGDAASGKVADAVTIARDTGGVVSLPTPSAR